MKTDSEIEDQIEQLVLILSNHRTNGSMRTKCLGMLQALLWVIHQEGMTPIEMIQEMYGPKTA